MLRLLACAAALALVSAAPKQKQQQEQHHLYSQVQEEHWDCEGTDGWSPCALQWCEPWLPW